MKKSAKPTGFNTFIQMMEALPDENSCRVYLEKILWDGIPVCPHCGSQNKDHYELKVKGEFKGLRKCKDCRERFTVTVGTMFEGSHAPLRKWFIAIFIFSSHKKGISSIQLGKDLGMTQTTAWFMLHRIRHTFGNKAQKQFSGVIQADESFIGGKNKNRHADKKVLESQGRSTKDKSAVFGMIANGDQVHAEVVPNTKSETLKPIIKDMVKKGSIVITDEWGAYNGLAKDYKHSVIKHQNNEYGRGAIHTNNIENFWSFFKWGLYGSYKHASKKHLGAYVDESTLRYNTRTMKENQRFDMSLKNAVGKLSYKELVSKKID